MLVLTNVLARNGSFRVPFTTLTYLMNGTYL